MGKQKKGYKKLDFWNYYIFTFRLFSRDFHKLGSRDFSKLHSPSFLGEKYTKFPGVKLYINCQILDRFYAGFP